MSFPWLLALACAPEADHAPLDRLVRVSMALRGVHPSMRELRQAARDPGAVEALARGWLADPRVGETVRDMHAEQLLVRIDTRPHAPPIGPLAGYTDDQIVESLDEAPLRLIEQIVTSGRPYTEIVTTPTTMADEVVAIAYGVPYDPSGPEWQEGPWADGRPAAGILSDTTLWERYMSAEANNHRTRGALVLNQLLCDPLDAAGVAILDPTNAEDAVHTDPACLGCHQVLDPVSGAFWGFRRYILPSETWQAYDDDGVCEGGEGSFACYPLAMWDEALVAGREERGLPLPALGGVPVGDPVGLGAAIAADPRFAACTARRFAGYLAQVDPMDVPGAEAEEFARTLVESGWDARELLLAVALSDWLADRPALVARPEQVDRAVEDLTGYAWTALPHPDHWDGPVRLATSDEFGLRAMMGGLNGWDTVRPEHRPTATRELAWEWLAAEAASVAVETGRLPIGGIVTRRGAVRDALADLHLRILAEDADDAELDASADLFDEALDRSGEADRAWKVVITAMLLDSRWVTY